MIADMLFRLTSYNDRIPLTSSNLTRFHSRAPPAISIADSITVASKALCDSYLTNSMYAKVGGITTKELNILELEFLFLIDWQLTASVEVLQNYYVNLAKQHPHFERVVAKPSTTTTNSDQAAGQRGLMWVD
ncbi:hypothetical protein HK102_005332 [Quaeritorhiza haematococci]|nr:hypothetical protein HK102_005332 [Quaeritorhiza haematococci]